MEGLSVIQGKDFLLTLQAISTIFAICKACSSSNNKNKMPFCLVFLGYVFQSLISTLIRGIQLGQSQQS